MDTAHLGDSTSSAAVPTVYAGSTAGPPLKVVQPQHQVQYKHLAGMADRLPAVLSLCALTCYWRCLQQHQLTSQIRQPDVVTP